MKKTFTKVGILSALMSLGLLAQAQSRIQVIHNSPDAAAVSVDIFIDNVETLSDVDYRTATAFLDVPSTFYVGFAVASPTNTSANIIANIPVALAAGESYYVIADGLLAGSGSDAFGLNASLARESATSGAGNTDFAVYHGSIDAPVVDVYVEEAMATVVDNASYGDFSAYVEVANADYTVQVRDETSSVTVQSYSAALETLAQEDQSLLVMASGYLAPTSGQPAFGLFAVTSGGAVVALETDMARAQIIHNVPVGAAATVDIYVNDVLTLEDVAYQTATPFIDFPAGLSQTVDLVAPGSSDNSSPIFSKTFDALASGSYYVIAASGTAGQDLDLYIAGDAREAATSGTGNTDFAIFHGSQDAPAVDVYVEEAMANVAENIVFGEYTAYVEVANADYTVQVRNDASTATVQTYTAPLAALSLANNALIVVASGSLGDATFKLLAVTSGGAVVSLPTDMARAQIIHNVPLSAAATVDIWVNGALTLSDVPFRDATGFIDFPAGLGQTVDVVSIDGNPTDNLLITATLDILGSESYIVIANGDVANQPLALSAVGGAREEARGIDETEVLVYHGSTDAPTVDVWETGAGAGELIDDLMYDEFAGYLELPTASYVLEVRDDLGTTTVASYYADLSGLSLYGAAITIVASGYLVPATGEPAFGLYVALASGGALVELPTTVLSVEESEITGFSASPNPASESININVGENNGFEYSLIETSGREVLSGSNNSSSLNLGLDNVNPGTYVLRVKAAGKVSTSVIYKN